LHPGTPDDGLDMSEFAGRDPATIEQMHQNLRVRAEEFDLPMHPPGKLFNSRKALLMAEYARDTGPDVFEKLHWHLFRMNFVENQNLADLSHLRAAAEQVGLNPDAAIEAIDRPEYAQRIEHALAEGQAAGITGVPGFIIENRYRLVGALPYEQMAAAFRQVQEMLAKSTEQ
jgi:predicted DsbA family dithiol-disulfide isomerase